MFRVLNQVNAQLSFSQGDCLGLEGESPITTMYFQCEYVGLHYQIAQLIKGVTVQLGSRPHYGSRQTSETRVRYKYGKEK